LFVRLVGGADVFVAQIAQHLAIVVVHAAGEVGVIEMAVARGLRHVAQYAEALLNGFLAVPRELLPLGQHFILEMIALLRGELAPICGRLPHLLLPLRRQLIELALIFHQAGFLLRRQVAHALLNVGRRNSGSLLAGLRAI